MKVESWKLAKVFLLWWKGKKGLLNYMSCRDPQLQVMQSLLLLHCQMVKLLDFGICVLGIWVRTEWLNWEEEDFLMVKVLVNWSFMSTTSLGSREASNSQKAFTTQRGHSIIYIMISSDHIRYRLRDVLVICWLSLMIFPEKFGCSSWRKRVMC